MIIRQSANAAVHLVGGIVFGILVAGTAFLAMHRQRRPGVTATSTETDPAGIS